MLTYALATTMLLTPAAQMKPGELVSKMFARYSAAEKLSGTISFKQSGAGKSVEFTTAIQYQRPFKLYIRQERRGSNLTSLTVADGAMFTYEMPDTVEHRRGDRLYEMQNQGGVVNNVGDVYSIGQPGLLDHSPILDIVIAKNEHLRFIRGQIASLAWLNGNPPEEGQTGMLSGEWRAYQAAPVSGKFVMAITSDGDIQRLTINEYLAVPNQTPIAVTSDWTVNIKVGDAGDEKLFRVVRR